MKLVYIEIKDNVTTDSKTDDFETEGEFQQLVNQEAALLISVDQIGIADQFESWSRAPRKAPMVVEYHDGSIGTWYITE